MFLGSLTIVSSAYGPCHSNENKDLLSAKSKNLIYLMAFTGLRFKQ